MSNLDFVKSMLLAQTIEVAEDYKKLYDKEKNKWKKLKKYVCVNIKKHNEFLTEYEKGMYDALICIDNYMQKRRVNYDETNYTV